MYGRSGLAIEVPFIVINLIFGGLPLSSSTNFKLFLVSIYLILPSALGSGVHSGPNRNEYQKQKNNVSGE
jgi:hypothetical protein